MSKQEFIKTQTCVLRVNIQCDCDGCRNKVKKLLLKVDGVYTVSIDAKQGKVTVAGNVDPAVLIQKLEKSGKHAELWGGQKGNNQFNLATQFKNLQMDSGKGGHNKGNNNSSSSNNKTQKGGGGGGKDHQHQHQQHQKGGHGQQMFQPQMQQHHNQSQQMKGSKDQKSVKFNVPQHANHNNNNNHFDEDFEDGDDYDDDDEYDDEDEDGHDDEFDEDEENEFDDVFGQPNHSHAKNNIHVMGNNAQKNKANGKTGKDKKSGGGNGGATKAKKSSGGFSLPAIFKSIAGNGNADDKKSNGSKKGNNGHGNNNTKGGNHNKGGNGGGSAAKHGGKGVGEAKIGGKNGGGGNNKKGGANNGHNNGKKGGGGGSKGEGFHEMSVPHHNGKGNGNMGPMGQMGNYPMGHNNIPAAAHGLPASGMMNGVGYYNQGMMMGGPPATAAYGNPYANQQYMAMMMNQQRMNGEGMHPQMMYGRPPAYMMPMPPPPVYDPVTHIFSDENTGSCSIM